MKFPALAILAGAAWQALAQIPPPDRVLSEPRPAILSLGPFDVHARATVSFTYDDNINLHDRPVQTGGIQTGRLQEPLGHDFIFTFAPGFVISKAAALEDSRTALSLDYSPAFLFFLRNDSENSIDHTARLNAGHAWTKLTLGLVQSFASTAGGVVDVGSRVSQKNHSTALTARYEVTEKTFLQADGSYRIIDYETLTDSEEWSATPTANYQISPKVTLGLGLTFGQLFVARQSLRETVAGGKTNQSVHIDVETQTHLGPTLRASYKTTEKTDVSLSFGGEWRRFEDGSDSFGPVFSLSGSYRPVDGTTLTVSGQRRVQNSAVVDGANFTTTGGSAGVRQRLLDKLFASVSVSYDHSDYGAAQRDVNTTRQDDYFLLRTGLDAIIGRTWSMGIFYQYRDNVSNDERFSFQNNQIGIQAAWGY